MKKHEEELEQQNAELKQQLEDRTLRLKQTGSIAEAALALNHVFEAAQAAADDYLNSIKATIYALLVVAAVVVLLATIFLPVLQVSGDSMNPTLQDKDILLLIKTENMKTGDLCGFYWQNKLLLKRIIGGPGDVISIDKNGVVTVNDEALDEPYVDELALGECDIKFPYQVPENCYFVMGDHRTTFIDSRSTAIGCAVLLVLSLLTVLAVNWKLHYVGTSMTTDDEYYCGYEEHVHTDECYEEVTELTCDEEEHVHLADYSADVETEDDWEKNSDNLSSASRFLRMPTS